MFELIVDMPIMYLDVFCKDKTGYLMTNGVIAICSIFDFKV